ncbi:aminoglycoside phosphotransferase [Streptomyces spiroverticillatus]|uniref:Aminoglycoside phosphotransferase n=1 Tax=Streptomyces finlayi TaxID=67296 RepID=A0A918WZY7_9ACTN|nr:phosphotransferase [Streptomyces finlayi]GHA16643.1 aminoglycoside phosphotransferase [Streptomyces spiroverticillatus]GHC98803.1 aminoglycoside phosphotransferase [Streptomyces finlayi]
MRADQRTRAVEAAVGIAASLGLDAEDVTVLNDSNKLALRLLPCDVLARVAPVAEQVAEFEVDLAQRLRAAGAPVAAPDPRVGPRAYEKDGFVVTLWTYYESVGEPVAPAAYADALARLHAGMRAVDMAAPHCTDRVAEAVQIVEDRALSPELADVDRQLLADTLRSAARRVAGTGQLLHGEPHPGNVLNTRDGVVFIDLETCCRGPVEFDLAHAPEEVGAAYPGADAGLLRECRVLVTAMVTAWRWDRNDQFPDGRRMGREWLERVRAAVGAGPASGA